ncbi:hypothetical protein DV454_001476 [Geotrichum candidum]|nr:hypothetical protein DV454_001476 [Geotrichum candidum]
MAVMRMSRLPSSTRQIPSYSSVSSEALLARFFQVCQLLTFFSVLVSAVLTLFLHVSWISFVPIVVLRAVPLFLALIVIVLYRKTNVRLNYLPFPSGFAEFWARFVTSTVYAKAFAIYSLSILLFFWSFGYQITDIGVTTRLLSGAYSLPKLNERYLYIKLVQFWTSAVFAAIHVGLDFDRLEFKLELTSLRAQKRISGKIGYMLSKSLVISSAITVSAPVIYVVFRKLIWSISLTIARSFYTLHHVNSYSGFPIGLNMILTTFVASFLIVFGWIFANVIFSVYMTLGPSYRSELISAKSNDKNGTLVTGLQAKHKQLIRMLAFLELVHIAINVKDRRVSIFADIDRKVSIWTQIKNETLGLVDDIIKPLEKIYKQQENKPKPVAVTSSVEVPAGASGIPATPIAIKEKNIFARPSSKATIIDGLQDKNALASKEVIGVVQAVKQKFHDTVKANTVYVQSLLESEMLYPLRFTISRRARQIIPNPSLTVVGVSALSALVCHSIEDDQYGMVQKDIASILDRLVDAHRMLRKFIDTPPVHWSNPHEKVDSKRDLADVLQVLDAVDEAFTNIVHEFYDYLPSLGLSPKVIDVINKRLN